MNGRVSVYSDFEALPAGKRCLACEERFTTPGRLCKNCRIVFGDEGPPEAEKPVKKTMQPPTEAQLERINELKELPEFQDGAGLDWLLAAIEKGMLNTRGQAGILINQMKKKSGLTP